MLKVFLVDDEIRVLNHLKLAVNWNDLGLTVSGYASNGLEALELLKKDPPDILITDIRMPGINGLELCRRLRETNPEMPIILLTGYSDFEYAKCAIELQVTDYCLKPIDTAALSETLRRCIKKCYNRVSTRADALLDLIETENTAEIRRAFSDLGLRSHALYLAGSIGVHNIEKQLHADLSYKVGKHKYLYFSSSPMDKNAALKVLAYAQGRCGIGLPSSPFSYGELAHAIDDVLVMTFQYFINKAPTLCSDLIPENMSDRIFAEFEEKKDSPRLLKPWLHNLAISNCSMLFNIRTAFRLFNRVMHMPVRYKALQTANANRLSFDSADTFALALTLLRTYASADSRKRGGFRDDLICLFKFALRHMGNKFRNGNHNGTPGNTGLMFAVKAPLGLPHGHDLIVSQSHFLKVFIAHVRRLLRHRRFR